MVESQAKRFVKHTGIYAIGNIARQLTGFIMLPIYTRYLTPADYGVVGLLIFSLSLIEIVFGARMGQAMPKFYHAEQNQESRSEIIATAWVLTTSVSLLTCIILMVNGEGISWFLFDSSQFTLAVTLFSINLVTMGMENYGLIYLRIREMPILFVSIGIIKLIIQIALNIYLVVIQEMGVLGVVLSSVIASSLFALGLSLFTLHHTRLRFKVEKAKELIIFSWPLWLAGFAALYIGSSNRYYIGHIVSLDDVGFFELASKFSQILMVLIWVPIMQYWEVERFKYYDAANPAPAIYRDMHKVICIILISASLAIVLFSKPVIFIMADSAFHDAYKAVIWLVFANLIECMTMYTNFSFHAASRTKIIRNNNYITAFIVTILYLMLIPVMGFVGAAMALCLARLMQFFLAYTASKKIYDMELDIKSVFYLISCSFIVVIISDQIVIHNIIYETVFRITVYLLSLLWLWFFIKRDVVLYELVRRVLINIPVIGKSLR